MPFCFAERNVLFPSSREQAIVRRTIAFNCSNPYSVVTAEKQNPIRKDGVCFLAEQEGFEPSVPFWGTHDFQSCPL